MDGHQFRGARIHRDMMLVSSVCRRALGCDWGGLWVSNSFLMNTRASYLLTYFTILAQSSVTSPDHPGISPAGGNVPKKKSGIPAITMSLSPPTKG